MNKKTEAKLVDLLTNMHRFTTYRDQFNQYLLHNKVDVEFIRKYTDLIPWDSVSFLMDDYDESFLRQFQDYINWNMLGLFGSTPYYSYDFIREFIDKLRIKDIINGEIKRRSGRDEKMKREFLGERV